MNQIKITQIDVDTAWEIPWKCWELMKTNYWLALSLALTVVAGSMLQGIPLIGVLISTPLIVAMRIGILFVVKDWENKESSSFSKFMEKAFDKEILQALLPIIIAEVALALLGSVFMSGDTSFGLMVLLGAPGLFISFVMSLMIPQLVFNKELSIQKAFNNSLEVIKLNIIPLFFVWMFFALLGLVATVLLLLPLFFCFLPASICMQYVMYRTLLEGLVLKDPTPSQEN